MAAILIGKYPLDCFLFPCLTRVSVPPPDPLFQLPDGTYGISFDLWNKRIRDPLPDGWGIPCTGAHYEY